VARKKAQSNHELKPGKPTRPPYDRILIVCEGKKTEPNYFNEIRIKARISPVHICVLQGQGTQPLKVVDSAVLEFQERDKEFEHVFAVFDRDEHDNYPNAIARAESLNGKLTNDEGRPVVFKAIVSVPCFELWFLLHYENVQHSFGRDEIYSKLKNHIANYEKNSDDIYEKTSDYLPIAIGRAKILKKRFSRLTGNDPYTDVHELVCILRKYLKENLEECNSLDNLDERN